jgi:hypothetical protein
MSSWFSCLRTSLNLPFIYAKKKILKNECKNYMIVFIRKDPNFVNKNAHFLKLSSYSKPVSIHSEQFLKLAEIRK